MESIPDEFKGIEFKEMGNKLDEILDDALDELPKK